MQLRLPWAAPGAIPPPPPRQIVVDGREVPVVIARHRRARRYVLRMRTDGALRLTVPRGASIAGGLRFAARQEEWIAREWRREQARAEPWRAGTAIWYRGERTIIQDGRGVVLCGPEIVRVTDASDVRAAVEAHLRGVATKELTARTETLAARHGFKVVRVRVGSARSRWGSCSRAGVVSLNWRLVQMPPAVEDYVILHELAHLRQPNHSRRFWREVASICPGWREAEQWLRKFGREII